MCFRSTGRKHALSVICVGGREQHHITYHVLWSKTKQALRLMCGREKCTKTNNTLDVFLCSGTNKHYVSYVFVLTWKNITITMSSLSVINAHNEFNVFWCSTADQHYVSCVFVIQNKNGITYHWFVCARPQTNHHVYCVFALGAHTRTKWFFRDGPAALGLNH